MTIQTRSPLDRLDIGEIFGQVIQELRRQRGLSQEALGFETGLHRTYVSLLERGKRIPTLVTIFLLATALKLPPSEIVYRVESRLEWSAEKIVE